MTDNLIQSAFPNHVIFVQEFCPPPELVLVVLSSTISGYIPRVPTATQQKYSNKTSDVYLGFYTYLTFAALRYVRNVMIPDNSARAKIDILLHIFPDILHLKLNLCFFEVKTIYTIDTIPANNFMEDRNSSTKVCVYEAFSSIIFLKYIIFPTVNVCSGET